MASLTATALPALGIVKLTLDWAPYVNEPVSLYRIEPDGREVEILGSPIRLSGSVGIAYDTTAPLDVNLTYKAVMSNPLVVRDDMGRTVSNTWGTPDLTIPAGTWSNTGTNSDYNVAAGVATQKHTSVALGRHNWLPGTYGDVQIGTTISVPVTPVTQGIRVAAMTRYVDQNNHYQFNIVHNTSGKITLNILRRQAGADTIIATAATPFEVNPNRLFRLVAQSVGTRHRMTVWWATGEQNAVTLEVSDSTFTAAGKVGVRSVLLTGNTNTLPISITFDAFRVYDLSTYTLTSGTVSVTAAPHGWIRDPLVPGNSIRLDNCSSHTFDCLNSNRMVFFRGFGPRSRRSTTGVFEVNNSDRPVTVSSPRKAPTTDLRFASVTLADVTRIENLFASGRNLSLYLPLVYGWGLDSYGADMFTAGDLDETLLNTTDQRKPYRLWSAEIALSELDDDLPHLTVGGNGIPIPGATYADMKATGKTYAQLRGTTPLNINPYFETNSSGWSGIGGTAVRSTAQFHQGVASLLLTPDGVSAQAVADSEAEPVTAGGTYQATAWVRCAVARNVHLGINWYNASVGYMSTSAQPDVAVAANTWTQLSFTATAPVGAAYASVNAVMGSTPLASHLLYVDEITIASTGNTYLDWAQGDYS